MFREVRWTEDREDHIARHSVTPLEVEDVLFGRPLFAEDDPDDGSTVVLGRTAAGRYLFVAVLREDQQGLTFPLTARDMTDREKRIYRRQAR